MVLGGYVLPANEILSYQLLTAASGVVCLVSLAVSIYELVAQIGPLDTGDDAAPQASPTPRWSIRPTDHAAAGALETSHPRRRRGCRCWRAARTFTTQWLMGSRELDTQPLLLLLTSVSATVLLGFDVWQLTQPRFPFLVMYPSYGTMSIIHSALVSTIPNLVMLKRVLRICIRRTRFRAVLAPVTVTLALVLLPVNSTMAYLNMLDFEARDAWANLTIPLWMVAVNTAHGLWGVLCTVYAYRAAFAAVADASPASSRVGTALNRTRASIKSSWSRSRSRAASTNGAVAANGASGATLTSPLTAALSTSSAPAIQITTTSTPAPSRPAPSRPTPRPTQYLLRSVKRTYLALTVVYCISWFMTLVIFGTAGGALSTAPRSPLSSILAGVGIVIESQFRRIVRIAVENRGGGSAGGGGESGRRTDGSSGKGGGRGGAGLRHFDDTTVGAGQVSTTVAAVTESVIAKRVLAEEEEGSYLEVEPPP
ncbi:hypothetical protein H9P43_008773 [Blastocladiella emersonii ATCC 22665]|nr:hypothetical protein H9P43_008773 [Blastocladiella emersonii ATCC 22665]